MDEELFCKIGENGSHGHLAPDQEPIAIEQGSNPFLAKDQGVLFQKKEHKPREASSKFAINRRRTNRERSLGLTPTAIWLLNYILLPRLKKSRGAWTRLNLTELSERKQAPSRRALSTALNCLEKVADEVGIKIRCTFDLGKPTLLVASTAWLVYDQEPLFFTKSGSRRNLRTRCRGPNLEDQCQRKSSPKIVPFANNLTPQARFLLEFSCVKNVPIHCADNASIPYSEDKYLQQQQTGRSVNRHPVGFEALKNYAAAVRDRIKHRFAPGVRGKHLRQPHYDNAKVFWSRDAAFGFVLDALRAGHREGKILKAYGEAMLFAHGVATDEISNGTRMGLAPPSLLIWKARKILADGRSDKIRSKQMGEAIYKQKTEWAHRLNVDRKLIQVANGIVVGVGVRT